MKTIDGKKMTLRYATEPVGSVLKIAPAFIASTIDETTGIESAVEAHYVRARGEYVITGVANKAVRDEFDDDAMRRVSPVAIMQVAIPHCIAVRLDNGPKARWVTVAELTSKEGRLVPKWMAEAVVKRGMKEERLDVIEIIYGAAALSRTSPVKSVQLELDVPHRTASDWIGKARAAGRLEGISFTVGRQPDGKR